MEQVGGLEPWLGLVRTDKRKPRARQGDFNGMLTPARAIVHLRQQLVSSRYCGAKQIGTPPMTQAIDTVLAYEKVEIVKEVSEIGEAK
jgi:hypothetical protein